jgi:hypothetical protein
VQADFQSTAYNIKLLEIIIVTCQKKRFLQMITRAKTLFSYGIKEEEIKSVFGSKNIILERKIKETRSYESYKDFLPEGFLITPADALTEIIYGKAYDVKSDYAYAYALICICEAFGDVLPYEYEFEENDIHTGEQINLINKIMLNEYNIKDLSVEKTLLKENSNPFEIPKLEGLPLIGMIKNKELPILQAKLEHIIITDEKIENLLESDDKEKVKKGLAYQHVQAFINNINDCIEFDYDYITFCH